MRARTILILSALLASATVAAAEPQRESPRDKALMFYFSKSFGGAASRAPAPLAFGLRLQQSSPFDSGRAVALVDARYWLGGPRMLAFAGVPTLSLGGEDDADVDSSGDSSGAFRAFGRDHPGWTAVAIVGALLGGACLVGWGVCEDDEDERNTDTTGG